MNPTWRSQFHWHLVAALNAIAATADERMLADPANCRSIRIEAENALATLRSDLQPDPSWAADQRAAFEVWRARPSQEGDCGAAGEGAAGRAN